MHKFKKIFCAVDLTEHSVVVADYAATLAKLFESEVMVLYVAPTLSQYVGFHVPPSSIETFVGEIVTGAEQAMIDFVAANFSGVKATGKVVTGYAAEKIVALAAEFNTDLIVMGTQGRVGFDRLVFGSVAERVLKSTSTPIMTIRPNPKNN